MPDSSEMDTFDKRDSFLEAFEERLPSNHRMLAIMFSSISTICFLQFFPLTRVSPLSSILWIAQRFSAELDWFGLFIGSFPLQLITIEEE